MVLAPIGLVNLANKNMIRSIRQSVNIPPVRPVLNMGDLFTWPDEFPAGREITSKQGAPTEPLKHKRACYKQVVPPELLPLSVYESRGGACL